MKEDTQQSIGKLLTNVVGTDRDAIHIAVMRVIAAEDMYPGASVSLAYGTKNQVKRQDYRERLGIIDPFLKELCVRKGQECWLFVEPNTVTGMTHHWQHPAFDQQALPTNESEEWLRKFAEKWNFDYDEMISEAVVGGYIVAMGMDIHSASELAPGDEDLFWLHIERLTGFKADDMHRKNFGWSCSC